MVYSTDKECRITALGVIESSDRFTFNYEVELPKLKESSEIWLPLAQSDSFQKIQILSINAPVKHRVLNEDSNKNRILHLKLLSKHSHEKIIIKYQVERLEKSAYSDVHFNRRKYLKSTALNLLEIDLK